MKLRMLVDGAEFEAKGQSAEVEQRYAEWLMLLRAMRPHQQIPVPRKLNGAEQPPRGPTSRFAQV